MADRTPRTTRDKKSRDQSYSPPSTLPMPDPVEGWKFGWLRVAMLGETDTMNIGVKRRDGWEFVRPSDMPDFAELAGFDPATADRIEIGGLALAKMPEARYFARRQYYQNIANTQIEAVDEQLLSNQDSRMPLVRERSQRTSRSPRDA